jgi:hypothetical protein
VTEQVAEEWSQEEANNIVAHELLHVIIVIGHPDNYGTEDELCQPEPLTILCNGRSGELRPDDPLLSRDIITIECLYQLYHP